MKEEIPPTEAEIKQHNLTHANYAPWCEHCVAGRGQELRHSRSKPADQPLDALVVQMDYMFIAPDGTITATQEKNSIPVLVAVDDRGAVEACYCTKKGPTDAYTIKVTWKAWA